MRWAGAHGGMEGAERLQWPSGGHVSAGWAVPECSGGEAAGWGRLEQPASEVGLRVGAAGNGGSAGSGVAKGWRAGPVVVEAVLVAVEEGAVVGREVGAGQRSHGSTGHVGPAVWTGRHQQGMGGHDGGDVAGDDGERRMLKRRMLKPGWGVSERGLSHVCCQTESPEKMMSLRGAEVGACIPQEAVVAAPSGEDVGC